MRQYKYEVIFNKPSKQSKFYRYDYSATRGRNIGLYISRNGIKIEAELSVLYDTEDVIVSTNHIFSDSIKKALLIYLILYSKNIEIKQLTVGIDGDYETIKLTGKNHTPPIYSLVVGKLHTSFPQEWDNESFFKSILRKTPSNYSDDTRFAALFAMVCAKSKLYEVEKFIYLWMAFNGLYDYLYEQVRQPNSKKRKTEVEELTLLIKLYNLGYSHVKGDEAKNVANRVISIISHCDLSNINSINEIPKEIESKIEKVLSSEDVKQYNITPKGYLLVSLPYYFRCNYIHAGRTLPLFCYADDRELKCLHLINILLEEFIDKNLYLFFDDTFVDKQFKEKRELIVKGKL